MENPYSKAKRIYIFNFTISRNYVKGYGKTTLEIPLCIYIYIYIYIYLCLLCVCFFIPRSRVQHELYFPSFLFLDDFLAAKCEKRRKYLPQCVGQMYNN